MLSTLGVKAPTTKAQRLAAVLDHYGTAERILAVVRKAPATTRALLERRAGQAEDPSFPIIFGAPDPDAGRETRWAVDRGLLIQDRRRYGPPSLPAEVARALRGPDWHAPFDAAPPRVSLTPVTGEDVAREAASAVSAFAAHAASVLNECAARPLTELKAGGVGVRELVRVGKAAQCEEPVVRLVLECAHACGLLARGSKGSRGGSRILVTKAYDSWAEQEPAQQVAELLRAWWELPATPTRSRDDEGKAVPALAPHAACQGCVQARRGLHTALQGLPGGSGVADPPNWAP